MEKRYDRLAAAGVRNISDYNERLKTGRLKNSETIVHRKMPYLVVVIDELADLMMTAAREVEEPIARLAQLARAVGIHLILATQRPSVDVITGVIKANFPARIAYQVASKIDSRTILDMNGADQLLGNGDMLYLPSGSPKPSRIQNAFISTDEVERLTDHIANQQGYSRPFQLPSILERKRAGAKGGAGERDEFFEEAARLIVRHQQGSVSLLQRRLQVGYSRAARIVDQLELAGIVGPFDGSKARLVLIDSEESLDRLLEAMDG
jgi:S-DNA-T family DNA segregation ATPase FtsK/SpoIIIE